MRIYFHRFFNKFQYVINNFPESDFASDVSGGSVRAGVETLLGSAGFEAKWGQSSIQNRNKQ